MADCTNVGGVFADAQDMACLWWCHLCNKCLVVQMVPTQHHVKELCSCCLLPDALLTDGFTTNFSPPMANP